MGLENMGLTPIEIVGLAPIEIVGLTPIERRRAMLCRGLTPVMVR